MTGKDCKTLKLGKKYDGGEHLLFLDDLCLLGHRIIIHEAMHVLGFDHTHSRSDRDNYISIRYENIKHGYENNFIKKIRTHNEIVKFDFSSIMMYPNKAFSKNNASTIVGKSNASYHSNLEELSTSDIQMILKIYNCQCQYSFLFS